MKKLIAAISLAVGASLLPLGAFAEEIKNPFFADYQAAISDWREGQFGWCYTHYKRLGVFSCLKTGAGYAQAYIGPTGEYSDWLRFGLGAGFEAGREDAPSPRYGGFAIFRRGSAQLALEAEKGGSGFWYRGIAESELAGSSFFGFSGGVMAEHRNGAGPRFALDMRKAYTKIWIAPLYDWEDRRVRMLVGARVILY